MAANVRIKKELNLIAESNFEHFKLEPKHTDNIYELEGFMVGPAGTPYEGGCFEFEIILQKDYPFKAPEFRFLSKVFHPNVNHMGYVSLEVLQEGKWSPAFFISMLVSQIHQLFSNPELGFINVEATLLYYNDMDRFIEVAKEWTKRFA